MTKHIKMFEAFVNEIFEIVKTNDEFPLISSSEIIQRAFLRLPRKFHKQPTSPLGDLLTQNSDKFGLFFNGFVSTIVLPGVSPSELFMETEKEMFEKGEQDYSLDNSEFFEAEKG